MTPEKRAQRPVQYPSWAVSPTRPPIPRPRREPPRRIANGDAAILSALPEIAARIAAGDTSLTPELRPAIATSAHGLAGSCRHYLPDNRLEWFDAQPWPSGPVNLRCPTDPVDAPPAFLGNTMQAFLCEFNPAVATIVGPGSEADGDNATQRYRRVPWPSVPGASPNAAPGMGFVTPTQLPNSVPIIKPIQVEGRIYEVLVNSVADGVTPDPSTPRPDLLLEFDVPQRAVGIEYVWAPTGDERRPDVEGVELRALAADGTDLSAHGVFSTGGELAMEDIDREETLLDAGLRRFIGIRDERGRISSVILRYGRTRPADPGDADFIVAPQIVFRVWYEALPGAVVKQNHIQSSRDEGGTLTTGRVEIKLPFNCDRAVAFLRGFRTEFPEPRQIWGLDVGVACRVGWSADGSARVAALWPSGVTGVEILDPPFTNRMYYTLLAWDSRQVDVLAISGSTRLPVLGPLEVPSLLETIGGWLVGLAEQPDEDVRSWNRGQLDTLDPCPDAPPVVGSETLNRCGPIVAVPTGLGFEFAEESDLDRLLFMSAEPFRRVPDGRSRVRWSMAATVRGDGEEVDLLVRGMILGGRGLVPVVETSALIPAGVDMQGYRTDGHFFWNDDMVLSRRIEADMAFVAVRTFSLTPDDEIRQVDIEVKAKRYDGQSLVWQVGGGTSTDDADSDGEHHLVHAFPTVVGVVRRSRFGGAYLEAQGARWASTAVGTHSGPATQYGVLRNSGDLVALITDVEPQGPHAGEFRFYFVYRGETIDQADLPARFPLRLQPGEILLIGGLFFPAGPGPRQASLLVTGNDRQGLQIAVPVVGETVDADPRAAITGHLNFGLVDVGRRYQKRFLLEAVGTTALVVHQIAVESPTLGFSVEQPAGDAQIDPGQSWILTVTLEPYVPGELKTQIVVQSNADPVTVPVQARALGPPLERPDRPIGTPPWRPERPPR